MTMSESLYDRMLSAYDRDTTFQQRNAVYEVSQEIVLSGLYDGGFFDEAAFYGGTCLRIFHQLPRFSEDLDFSLLRPNADFDFTSYFGPVEAAFRALGREVVITQKQKRSPSGVESAFLKDTTDVVSLTFQTEPSIKIKIEVDTCPPMRFETEQKLLLAPRSLYVRCFTLPDLYAGKMHALVYRGWRNRVKGRDWYDFEWYVKNRVPLHFAHLRERIREFNGDDVSREDFEALLRQKLATTDIDMVKRDVQPFLSGPSELAIWTNDYFLRLAEHMIYQ